jgi:hypothetical protein
MTQLYLFDDLVLDIGAREGKTCSKCNSYLPLSSFSNASGGAYLRSECRKCSNELGKVRLKLRSELPPPANDHVCPICSRDADQVAGAGGKKQKTHWVLDHNHETEEARGWLCHTCNRALGGFQDDVNILERAIQYLTQFSEPVNDNKEKNEL